VVQVLEEHEFVVDGRLAVGGRLGELDAVALGGRKHAAVEGDQLNHRGHTPFFADLLQFKVGLLDRLLDESLGLLARIPSRAGPYCAQRDDYAHNCRFFHCDPLFFKWMKADGL
jgi:hypothetical protein